MALCLHRENQTCGFRNPAYLAFGLLLAATLAVLSAFDQEGSLSSADPPASQSVVGTGEGTRAGFDGVKRPCRGCYQVVSKSPGGEPNDTGGVHSAPAEP